MKDDLTPEQKAARLEKAIAICQAAGWKHINNWIFSSPSGALHDLSAADLTRLESIEKNKSFILNSPDLKEEILCCASCGAIKS